MSTPEEPKATSQIQYSWISEDELHEFFDKIDTEHIGKIEVIEITEALKKMKVPLAASAAEEMKTMDETARHQKISFDDFLAIVRGREAMVKDLFDILDLNKDGELEFEELKEGLKTHLHLKLSHDELQTMFSKLQSGKSGPVSFRDFDHSLVLFPAHSQRELIQMWSHAGALSYMLYADRSIQNTPRLTLAAGFIAGGISRSFTAPFDRLSLVARAGYTQHHGLGIPGTLRSMVRSGGLRSLWRGNSVNVVQVGPESALTFFIYESFKKNFLSDPTKPTLVEKFSFGAGAGAMAMTLVYPMYVVQARMAVAEPGVYRGIIDCFHQTMTLEGPRALLKGYIPSLVRIIPYKGGDLMIFNSLREIFVKPGETIAVWQSMMFGALASSISQTLTYPLVTVRTKLQAQGQAQKRPVVYFGMVDTLKKTIWGDVALGLRAEGISGLYNGCAANLLKMVPAIALQFTVYEKSLKLLQNW